jgi:hypothetical protein
MGRGRPGFLQYAIYLLFIYIHTAERPSACIFPCPGPLDRIAVVACRRPR